MPFRTGVYALKVSVADFLEANLDSVVCSCAKYVPASDPGPRAVYGSEFGVQCSGLGVEG
jgi:hypothetical protein